MDAKPNQVAGTASSLMWTISQRKSRGSAKRNFTFAMPSSVGREDQKSWWMTPRGIQWNSSSQHAKITIWVVDDEMMPHDVDDRLFPSLSTDGQVIDQTTGRGLCKFDTNAGRPSLDLHSKQLL